METNIKSPILVTGCPRSGTSLVAGIIHKCGGWGGEMSGPTQYNPKGFFENIAIRDQVVKPLLKAIGCDPLGQGRFPKTEFLSPGSGCPTRGEFRNQVFSKLQEKGLTNQQWFVKGIKIAHLWPIWHAAFPGTKYVIVRRREHEIAKSCLRVPFMSAYDSESGWLWMIDQYLAKLKEMWEAGLQLREVWPEKIINGDHSEITGVINWLGLAWNKKEVDGFVEPKYWGCHEGN